MKDKIKETRIQKSLRQKALAIFIAGIALIGFLIYKKLPLWVIIITGVGILFITVIFSILGTMITFLRGPKNNQGLTAGLLYATNIEILSKSFLVNFSFEDGKLLFEGIDNKSDNIPKFENVEISRFSIDEIITNLNGYKFISHALNEIHKKYSELPEEMKQGYAAIMLKWPEQDGSNYIIIGFIQLIYKWHYDKDKYDRWWQTLNKIQKDEINIKEKDATAERTA
jgi:hypothetical protein